MSDKIDEIVKEKTKDEFADSLGIDTTSDLFKECIEKYDQLFEEKNENLKEAVCVYTLARGTTVPVLPLEVSEYYSVPKEQVKDESEVLAEEIGLSLLKFNIIDYLSYYVNTKEFSDDARRVAKKIYTEFMNNDKINIEDYNKKALSATIMWMASRITHIDKDNRTQKDVAEWYEDIESDDIKHLHTIIAKNTGFKIKDEYRYGKGISEAIVRLSDELYLPPEVHKDAFDILDGVKSEELNKYDNKSIAASTVIKSIQQNNYPLDKETVYEEMECRQSTMERIGKKLDILE